MKAYTFRYTGITGRIVGTIWGSLFATIGISACLFFLTVLGLLPSTLEQIVVDQTPLTSSIAAFTPKGTGLLALLVVFSLATAVLGLFGLLEIGKALFKTEYSIEVTVTGR